MGELVSLLVNQLESCVYHVLFILIDAAGSFAKGISGCRRCWAPFCEDGVGRNRIILPFQDNSEFGLLKPGSLSSGGPGDSRHESPGPTPLESKYDAQRFHLQQGP